MSKPGKPWWQLKSLPYWPGRTRIYQKVLCIIKSLTSSGYLSLTFGAKKPGGSRYVVDILNTPSEPKKMSFSSSKFGSCIKLGSSFQPSSHSISSVLQRLHNTAIAMAMAMAPS